MTYTEADLTNSRVQEAADTLGSYYGIKVNSARLREVVLKDETFLLELVEDSYTDTCIREDLLEAYTHAVTGQTWPTYGDNWSDDQMAALVEKINLAG